VTLRARLLLGLLGLVAVALITFGVVTYKALHSFLIDRVDQQLLEARSPVLSQLAGRPRERGPGRAPEAVVPAGTYAALIAPDGQILGSLLVGYAGEDFSQAPRPVLRARDLEGGGPLTVGATSGSRSFRLVASPTDAGSTLVVALPLDDVKQTLARLVAIELVATLAVLAGVGVLARWLVHRGLRPLEDMGRTAGAIAAGDLSRRVESDEETEVGRLGLALNRMLGQIESAFAAQQASEQRLRRFIADASHELRTPLTSIRGYAELFRRGAAERPEDLAKAMRRIEEESARMGVLVDDLLLLARLDQGRPLERERVDLRAIAADAVDDVRAVDPDRPIALEAPPADAVVVLGDDARLRQVVGNLLVNARQHTPGGTPVRVRITLDEARATLEVADQGPGLAPEQAARVFERFYRADDSRTRAHGGTGLGLAIVAAITEAHGGRVSVETAPGEGARFRVQLPVADVPSPDGAPASVEATDAESRQ
jgi:two-component system OmpR family sensor kinase